MKGFVVLERSDARESIAVAIRIQGIAFDEWRDTIDVMTVGELDPGGAEPDYLVLVLDGRHLDTAEISAWPDGRRDGVMGTVPQLSVVCPPLDVSPLNFAFLESEFKSFRSRLEQRRSDSTMNRATAALLDRLGDLLHEENRERLVERLEKLLGDLDAAERRADGLQAQLDQLRANQGEPKWSVRRRVAAAVSAVTLALLTGAGEAAAGSYLSDGPEPTSDLAGEVMREANRDGDLSDFDDLLDAAVEAARHLGECAVDDE